MSDYKEQISIFVAHNLTEVYIASLIVQALSMSDKDQIEIVGLPKKAYINNELDIVYNSGKRYKKLARAIKEYAVR